MSSPFNRMANVPTEVMDVYFMSQRGRAPKGKVFAKYYNQQRILKSSGLRKIPERKIQPETTTERGLPSLLEPEPDAETHLNWIFYENSSWPEIEVHWRVTTSYRLQDIRDMETTQEVLKKWRDYAKPFGYKLIDIDFEKIYPGCCNFLISFNKYSSKLLKIFENKIKEPNSVNILKNLSNSNIEEDGKSAAILHLLHALLIPTSRKITRDKNGKKSVVKFTIKDSQNSFMMIGSTVAEIEEALARKKEKGTAIQPFVIIIGPKVTEPRQILVYFDNIKYAMFSIVKAIDICFKIFHLFNLEYPVESSIVWLFLQKFCYNTYMYLPGTINLIL